MEVGSGVTSFRVGDAVYSLAVDKPIFRGEPPGFASEFGITEEHLLLHKPPQISFEDAASLLGSVITGYQSIREGLRLRGEISLEGKTILVPAGLGSTGSAGIQLAKNIFSATKVITTVSTSKLLLVEKHFPGVVSTVIDYNTNQVKDVVAPGSVDMMYNTQFSSMDQGIPVLNRKTGTLVSIASVPSKATMREIIGEDRFSFWLGWLLDLAQMWYMWKLWGTDILFMHVSGSPNIREDLEVAGEIISMGQVKPLVDVVDVNDIATVRSKCKAVLDGKGTTGKLVLKISG